MFENSIYKTIYIIKCEYLNVSMPQTTDSYKSLRSGSAKYSPTNQEAWNLAAFPGRDRSNIHQPTRSLELGTLPSFLAALPRYLADTALRVSQTVSGHRTVQYCSSQLCSHYVAKHVITTPPTRLPLTSQYRSRYAAKHVTPRTALGASIGQEVSLRRVSLHHPVLRGHGLPGGSRDPPNPVLLVPGFSP